MRCDAFFRPARATAGDRRSPFLAPGARAVRRGLAWLGALAACLIAAGASAATTAIRGLPFTRSYPFEEIGEVPRNARLGFDRFGRIAVIYEGFYAVLNDTVWLDLSSKNGGRGDGMSTVMPANDGRTYYGAMGSWGVAEFASDGKLRPQSLAPAEAPAWTLATEFSDIISTSDGVYFAGRNGVVQWHPGTRTTRFFNALGVSKIFAVGDEVFVSCYRQPLQRIDRESGALRIDESLSLGGETVQLATPLDARQTLIGTREGRFYIFDGRSVTPWLPQAKNDLTGRILALQHLADGGTALALAGKGLFVVSADGGITTALTTAQYHRITDLAAREPGVLWVATEDAVEKVLYGGPLSVFGQRLGVTTNWPTVVRWNERILVSSSGELFESKPRAPGVATVFEPVKNLPPGGAWAMAVRGPDLLLGNNTGVYAVEANGTYRQVLRGDVARLAILAPDLCLALGETEIAVLRHTAAGWSECAPRVAGVGFPTVVRTAKHSAWIELGSRRVARVALQNGALDVKVFDDFPWENARWINIGLVDDTIVLSGPAGSRAFFDEGTQTFVEAPELRQLLARSPYWIARIEKDEAGTLWATHNEGVVTFTPRDGDYDVDASTFDLVNARYPAVQVLAGNDVWFSTGRSLYHVEPRPGGRIPPPGPPALVSITDGRAGAELLPLAAGRPALQLSHAQNNLSFRFFAGGYAWHRAPAYEFQLNGAGYWSTLDAGSSLSFPELREGSHRVEVRRVEGQRPVGEPASFEFQILPPWYRTWPAYSLYGLGFGCAVFGLVRWSGHRARHRTVVLERLVDERTRELKATMEKLRTETRNAATLAERDRLAGEIHDSLQQGLSGLILQLDATLKLPSVTGDLRSRLNVARNMVSFTRHEVQHAVWDMESPLLEDTELGEALRKLTELIAHGATTIDVAVSGATRELPSAVKHHLLRIAQEAITNAVRHAAPQRIAIELDYRPDAVSLAVTDDGVGFDPDEVLSKSIGHFGLRGLRTRARKLPGELEIESSPGGGTTIRVVVPLSPFDSPPDHASATPA